MRADRLLELVRAVEGQSMSLGVYADALEDEGHLLAPAVRWLADNDRFPLQTSQSPPNFMWYGRTLDDHFRHWLPRCVTGRMLGYSFLHFGHAIHVAALAVNDCLSDGSLQEAEPASVRPGHVPTTSTSETTVAIGLTILNLPDETVLPVEFDVVDLAAVALDADSFEHVGSFQEYVRPRMSVLRDVARTSGVYETDIERADPLADVAARFAQWLSEMAPRSAVHWGSQVYSRLQSIVATTSRPESLATPHDLQSVYPVVDERRHADDPLESRILADIVERQGCGEVNSGHPCRATTVAWNLVRLLKAEAEAGPSE